MADQDQNTTNAHSGAVTPAPSDHTTPMPLAERRLMDDDADTAAPDFIYRDWASI